MGLWDALLDRMHTSQVAGAQQKLQQQADNARRDITLATLPNADPNDVTAALKHVQPAEKHFPGITGAFHSLIYGNNPPAQPAQPSQPSQPSVPSQPPPPSAPTTNAVTDAAQNPAVAASPLYQGLNGAPTPPPVAGRPNIAATSPPVQVNAPAPITPPPQPANPYSAPPQPAPGGANQAAPGTYPISATPMDPALSSSPGSPNAVLPGSSALPSASDANDWGNAPIGAPGHTSVYKPGELIAQHVAGQGALATEAIHAEEQRRLAAIRYLKQQFPDLSDRAIAQLATGVRLPFEMRNLPGTMTGTQAKAAGAIGAGGMSLDPNAEYRMYYSADHGYVAYPTQVRQALQYRNKLGGGVEAYNPLTNVTVDHPELWGGSAEPVGTQRTSTQSVNPETGMMTNTNASVRQGVRAPSASPATQAPMAPGLPSGPPPMLPSSTSPASANPGTSTTASPGSARRGKAGLNLPPAPSVTPNSTGANGSGDTFYRQLYDEVGRGLAKSPEPGTPRGAGFTAWMGRKGLVPPEQLSNSAMTSLSKIEPVQKLIQDQIDALNQKRDANGKLSNVPLEESFKTFLYKHGLATSDEDLINKINLGTVMEAGRLMVGQPRSEKIVDAIKEHTPNTVWSSYQQMYDRLVNMKRNVDEIADAAKRYGNKYGVVQGQPSTPTNETAIDTPPTSALKSGYNTTFKNGQVWTLLNGKASRVK